MLMCLANLKQLLLEIIKLRTYIGGHILYARTYELSSEVYTMICAYIFPLTYHVHLLVLAPEKYWSFEHYIVDC